VMSIRAQRVRPLVPLAARVPSHDFH
jgi:hypothetical protein